MTNIDTNIDTNIKIYDILLFLTTNIKFNSLQYIINYFKNYYLNKSSINLENDNTLFYCEI